MGKILIFMIVLFVVALVLSACGSTEKWPRVCIERTDTRFDCINVPLRDGYTFAEDLYDIEETDIGYDVVVHAVKPTD